MANCPPYAFAGATDPWWDRNLDGSFTISDIGPIIGWLLNAPGNFAVQLMIDSWPEGAAFFELDCSSGNEVFSIIVSVFVWLIILGLIGSGLEAN